MSGEALFKLVSALICDDVRREANGKFILIGAYSGDVRVNKFPAALALQLVLQTDASSAGEAPFEIRVRDGEQQLAAGGGELKSIAPGPALVPLPAFPFFISQETTLHFEVKLENREWEMVRALNIKLSSAPLQP